MDIVKRVSQKGVGGMNTHRSNMVVLGGLSLLVMVFFGLQGCKKESPQVAKERPVVVTKAVAAVPKQGHKEIGLSLYKEGKNEEAIAELKKAIADNTANVEVYYKLACAYYDEELTDDAIQTYKKTLEMDPKHVEAHYDLGLIYIDEEMYDSGIKELQKVLELDPQHEDALYSLGDAYYECKKVDEAIKTWETLLKDEPSDSILHYNLGLAYRDKGLKNQAISMAEKAIALDPQNDEAKELLKQITSKTKKTEPSKGMKDAKKEKGK